MALRKQWRTLDRATVGKAPDRFGYYELGDADGTVVDSGVGVLRDALKDALSYGSASKVRWTEATSREHAERLAEEHR
ncbi:DUF7508 domain-containing protein [Halogranum rubrum]|uniref:DUF7508 domain-containing protein n=1 Tax=Halogranum salarium B-1 TaxID=1210908 RepID=J2ZKW0_9EURY|nr:hypothetical protein [Halogranum salarium]EJN61360.1 hypothetical protein HSB1_04010 [Halogranum salarium B-1]